MKRLSPKMPIRTSSKLLYCRINWPLYQLASGPKGGVLGTKTGGFRRPEAGKNRVILEEHYIFNVAIPPEVEREQSYGP